MERSLANSFNPAAGGLAADLTRSMNAIIEAFAIPGFSLHIREIRLWCYESRDGAEEAVAPVMKDHIRPGVMLLLDVDMGFDSDAKLVSCHSKIFVNSEGQPVHQSTMILEFEIMPEDTLDGAVKGEVIRRLQESIMRFPVLIVSLLAMRLGHGKPSDKDGGA